MPIKNHKSGIYLITNTANEKVYIGQSSQLSVRWRQHKSDLKSNYHKNKYLQADYNLHGLVSFEYSVLEYVDIKILGDEREQYWISRYKSSQRENGYNIDLGGIDRKIRSEETILKMSLANKGRKQPIEEILKRTESLKKVNWTEEHKSKLVKSGKLTRFTNNSIPWNKNTKGVMKANNTSFEKGGEPWNKAIITDEMMFDKKNGMKRKQWMLKHGKTQSVWERIAY